MFADDKASAPRDAEKSEFTNIMGNLMKSAVDDEDLETTGRKKRNQVFSDVMDIVARHPDSDEDTPKGGFKPQDADDEALLRIRSKGFSELLNE